MRYHYLDALRSVLMMLGVVYHTSLMYSTIRWRVSNPERPVLFDALIDFNHWFRMPTFFMIAGFFTLFSLRRHGSVEFLKTKTMRILVPIFVTAFTANAAMNYIHPTLFGRQPDPLRFIQNLPASYARGELHAHLWFLYYLCLYYLIFVSLRAVLGRWSWVDRLKGTWHTALGALRDPSLLILPLALINVALVALEVKSWPVYTHSILHTFQVGRTLTMLAYFLFGAWMFGNPALYESFCRIRRWHVAVFFFALLIRLHWNINLGRFHGRTIMAAYANGIITWTLCLACFATFKRFFDRPSKLWSYLSDASYTVYLFHLVFVVSLGALMRTLPISPYFKAATVMTATFACTLAIHHFLVLRVGVFRFLYNGKFLRKKPASATASVVETAATADACASGQ